MAPLKRQNRLQELSAGSSSYSLGWIEKKKSLADISIFQALTVLEYFQTQFLTWVGKTAQRKGGRGGDRAILSVLHYLVPFTGLATPHGVETC